MSLRHRGRHGAGWGLPASAGQGSPHLGYILYLPDSLLKSGKGKKLQNTAGYHTNRVLLNYRVFPLPVTGPAFETNEEAE